MPRAACALLFVMVTSIRWTPAGTVKGNRLYHAVPKTTAVSVVVRADRRRSAVLNTSTVCPDTANSCEAKAPHLVTYGSGASTVAWRPTHDAATAAPPQDASWDDVRSGLPE